MKAEKGDLIRVVALDDGQGSTSAFMGEYKLGDILEVAEGPNSYGITTSTNHALLYDHEYVIHRKAGEEESVPKKTRCLAREAQLQVNEGKTPEEAVAISMSELSQDAVVHPNHYTQGRFETIEIIEEITKGYSDGFTAYCVGNALKYEARAPFKHDSPIEDLRKAERYIQYAIAHEQRKIDGN